MDKQLNKEEFEDISYVKNIIDSVFPLVRSNEECIEISSQYGGEEFIEQQIETNSSVDFNQLFRSLFRSFQEVVRYKEEDNEPYSQIFLVSCITILNEILERLEIPQVEETFNIEQMFNKFISEEVEEEKIEDIELGEELKILSNNIIENTSLSINQIEIMKIFRDLERMIRSNDEILMSFHIKEEMKPVITNTIEDIKGFDLDTLLGHLIQLNEKCLEFDRNGEYDNSTLGNSLLITMINEMKTRF